MSLTMLKAVVGGESYAQVAGRYGMSRSAVERRIKRCAKQLAKEVGIDGISEAGAPFVQRLRNRQPAVVAAIEQFTPTFQHHKSTQSILTNEDIARLVQRTSVRSPCPHRDVAMLYVLLSTGARPLEIARLQVRDYLNDDGSVCEESLMREEASINHKSRPLFFASVRVQQAIDRYLIERVHRRQGVDNPERFRGLAPISPLFLTETGAPFEIVAHGQHGQRRSLCRGILNVYRNIFRRAEVEEMSALRVRRTVATRLFERGACPEQIGEFLGIREMKTVRKLLPKVSHPLMILARELV